MMLGMIGMLNDLTTRQIVELAGQGVNAEEIATTLSVELPLVKLVLNRNELGSAQDRDIDDAQLSQLRGHAFWLATQSADISVAAKMTRFLLERDKPRTSSNASGASPITQVNIAIAAAQENFKKLTAAYFTPQTEVENH